MSAAYHYPTDLTDEQWDLLQTLLPERKWRPGGRGRPPFCDLRSTINSILYLNKTGCRLCQEVFAFDEANANVGP